MLKILQGPAVLTKTKFAHVAPGKATDLKLGLRTYEKVQHGIARGIILDGGVDQY